MVGHVNGAPFINVGLASTKVEYGMAATFALTAFKGERKRQINACLNYFLITSEKRTFRYGLLL